MEKLLKSGGAFGGKQDLSDTFKKIRGELEGSNGLDVNEGNIHQNGAQNMGIESAFDDPSENNNSSKLLMESPGQNTFVQN